MSMKRFLSLFLTIVMVMSLVACGGKDDADNKADSNAGNKNVSTSDEKEESTEKSDPANSTPAETKYAESVTIALPSGLSTLDPATQWNTNLDVVNSGIFETLVKYDGVTGEISPWLAETAEFTDENNNRIHIVLRNDVYFSNGDKLTTEDVEFSLGRTTRSTIQQYYASCEIVDDREMYINMSDTCGEWLGALGVSFAAIVSKDDVESNPDGKATIGTGPYIADMDSYVVENKITLTRNEDYWGEKPVTKQRKFVVINDASARGVALANGEIDLTIDLNPTEVAAYKAKDNLEVVTYPSTRFIYVIFNDKRDSDAVSEGELALRRAIACAMNRDEIVAASGESAATPMISMWRPDASYIDDESEFDIDLSYNPEKAKEYLAQADTTEIDCLVNATTAQTKVAAQVIQEQLRQVGITMNIIESDSAAIGAMMTEEVPEYEMIVFNNMITFLPCAGWTFFQHMSNINGCAMYDPDILAALDVVMTTSDLDEKIENLQIIQKENHDQVSYLPAYWREGNYACVKGLEGFNIEASGLFHIDEIAKVIE